MKRRLCKLVISCMQEISFKIQFPAPFPETSSVNIQLRFRDENSVVAVLFLCNHHSGVSNLYTLILYWSVYEKLWFNPVLHSHSPRSLDILTKGQKLHGQNLTDTVRDREGDKDKKKIKQDFTTSSTRNQFVVAITVILTTLLFPSFTAVYVYSMCVCLRILYTFCNYVEGAVWNTSIFHEDLPLHSLFSLVVRCVNYA